MACYGDGLNHHELKEFGEAARTIAPPQNFTRQIQEVTSTLDFSVVCDQIIPALTMLASSVTAAFDEKADKADGERIYKAAKQAYDSLKDAIGEKAAKKIVISKTAQMLNTPRQTQGVATGI